MSAPDTPAQSSTGSSHRSRNANMQRKRHRAGFFDPQTLGTGRRAKATNRRNATCSRAARDWKTQRSSRHSHSHTHAKMKTAPAAYGGLGLKLTSTRPTLSSINILAIASTHTPHWQHPDRTHAVALLRQPGECRSHDIPGNAARITLAIKGQRHMDANRNFNFSTFSNRCFAAADSNSAALALLSSSCADKAIAQRMHQHGKSAPSPRLQHCVQRCLNVVTVFFCSANTLQSARQKQKQRHCDRGAADSTGNRNGLGCHRKGPPSYLAGPLQEQRLRMLIGPKLHGDRAEPRAGPHRQPRPTNTSMQESPSYAQAQA